MRGLDRADQYGARGTFPLAHDIEAPVNAIGTIDVSISRRSEHDRVARCRPAKGMRGGVGMVIGLDLDDDPTDAIEKESCTDKVWRNDVDAAREKLAGEGSTAR